MYRSLIFAGGGCRCFWQVGFLEVVMPALDLRPTAVGAVSAGAAMACLVFAGMTRSGLQAFKDAIGGNRRNLFLLNLLRGEPVFPQARMYRDTMLDLLDGASLEALHRGPDIRVVVARTPTFMGPRMSLAAAAIVDQAQRIFSRRLHPRMALRLGFRPEVISVRECRTPWQLAQLILHSSCTPPFTPYYRRHGAPALDGGLIDSVPVSALDCASSPALVLLTRPHAETEIPRENGHRYVWPSQPVPVAKWDYTSPEKVQATFELGLRDGERFVRGGLGTEV